MNRDGSRVSRLVALSSAVRTHASGVCGDAAGGAASIAAVVLNTQHAHDTQRFPERASAWAPQGLLIVLDRLIVVWLSQLKSPARYWLYHTAATCTTICTI